MTAPLNHSSVSQARSILPLCTLWKHYLAVVVITTSWVITTSTNHTLSCRPWQYFTTKAYAVSYLAAYGFQIGSWFFMIGGAALLDPRVGF